jgi:rRNA maturation endonuclease Nob1
MSIGALLIGLAALILTIAYIAAPFRQVSRQPELDAQIEAWVADARKSSGALEQTEATAVNSTATAVNLTATAVNPTATAVNTTATAVNLTTPVGDRPPPALVDKPANYCHQCGEPVQPDHRFCRNCGARLVADVR